jgi:endonuclease/exonuclease/phosphatase family metal-dependent hydrolase
VKKSTLFSLFLLALLFLSSRAGHTQEVQAISFNIRFDNPGDGPNQWSERKDLVGDFVNYQGADFLGLQEALLSQINDILAADRRYQFIGVGRDDGAEAGEFTPILYDTTRWTLVSDSTFWLSDTPQIPSKSWDAALPRICTYGLFVEKVGRDTVFVFNTHFDHVGEEARRQSARLIIKAVNEISGNARTILMGDLNTAPESSPIREITLQDSFLGAEIVYGEEGTFSGFDVSRVPDRRIDYVFVSDDAQVMKYSTDSRLVDGRYISDHFPVIVYLTF